jgi:predicted nucleotidyltransferase
MLKKDTRVNVTKNEIIRTLKIRKDELAARYKVKQIGLFGSYARGEQNAESDIDLLVDFLPGADLFDLSGLKQYLEGLFKHNVDVVPTRTLRDEIRAAVLADVTYV